MYLLGFDQGRMHLPGLWLRYLPIALLLLGASYPAQAANAEVKTPADRMINEVRFVDFLARIIPGLRLEGFEAVTDQSFPFRNSQGEAFIFNQPITIRSLEAVRFIAEGRSGMAVIVDLTPTGSGLHGDSTTTLLAAFTGDPRQSGFDIINVGLDKLNSFSKPAVIAPGPAGGILLTNSTHFNSNQGYRTDSMFFWQNGKLKLIDRFNTFSEHGCGYDNNQTVSVRGLPKAGSPQGAFLVTVISQHKIDNIDCTELPLVPAFTKTIAVTYKWDENARNYRPDSDAFIKLAKENEERW